MKNKLIFILIGTVIFGCNSNTVTNTEHITQKIFIPIDTTPRVIGIGGIFFISENPAETKVWYENNLGMITDDYGSVFEFRNAKNPNEINYLRWSIFQNNSDYFSPSKKSFMINYRVQNIRGLITKLQKNGATILDTISTYEYGKFVHLLDPEGNKIELWEPVDSVLTKIGSKTNK